jgi:hypothetical protein
MIGIEKPVVFFEPASFDRVALPESLWAVTAENKNDLTFSVIISTIVER